MGFVNGLAAVGFAPAGKRVTLVEAGGAGAAIAVALLTADGAHLNAVPLGPRATIRCHSVRTGWPRDALVADIITASLA